MAWQLEKAKKFFKKSDWSLYFFYLFVFSIPFWRRLELYTDYSYLEGKFIDYLTYSLYGFEFFALISLIFWLWERMKSKKKFFLGNLLTHYSFAVILAVSFFSLSRAEYLYSGLYYVVVLLWLFFIYFFIINKIDNAKKISVMLLAIVLSGALQSAIAIGQFIKNGYLGLHFFGEQLLNIGQEGFAKINLAETVHIRAYGTFSHPNILAFFLIFAGFCALHLFFTTLNKKIKYAILTLFIFMAMSLILTFSRICWVVGFGLWGAYLLHQFFKEKKEKRKNYTRYFLVIAGVIIITVVLLWPFMVARLNPFLATTWESWEIRSVIIGKSWGIIKSHLWGIGIGNFMIEIAYLLTGYPVWMAEPVHNTFLLVWAEIGWIGLAAFATFLLSFWVMAKKAPFFLRYMLVAIFLIMFFDHGFWDIRQMQTIMFLVFGLIGAYYTNAKLGKNA